MEVVVHPDLASFDAATHDRLAADPVRNTIALTSLDRIRRLPADHRPTLITFHDHGEVIGSLIRTPPWPFQAADLPLSAVELAVRTVNEIDPDAPGVTGPRQRSEAFATATGKTYTESLATRLYRLGTLAPPRTAASARTTPDAGPSQPPAAAGTGRSAPDADPAEPPAAAGTGRSAPDADPSEPPAVAGTGRMATEADAELLGAWRHAFLTEAVPEAPNEDTTQAMRNSLRLGNGHALWEVDGNPVAWAAGSLPHADMTRIGPVYTPPEHRKHGYGAAVSAMVSQWALDQGATDVLLFADLTNPISNSIYQRIGYQPLDDWAEFWWKR